MCTGQTFNAYSQHYMKSVVVICMQMSLAVICDDIVYFDDTTNRYVIFHLTEYITQCINLTVTCKCLTV